MDPKVASELSLRIPHLALRVREHSARALFYAGMQSGASLGGAGRCACIACCITRCLTERTCCA